MMPFAIYSLLLPLTAIYLDLAPGRFVILSIALGDSLLTASALKLWHAWTSAQAAEAAAVRCRPATGCSQPDAGRRRSGVPRDYPVSRSR